LMQYKTNGIGLVIRSVWCAIRPVKRNGAECQVTSNGIL
jgi:hypothetical protein